MSRTRVLLTAAALSAAACTQPAASPTSPGASAPIVDDSHHFAIVQSTANDPHTVLLDTKTGQTWLLTTPPNGSAAWVQIYRPPAAQGSN